MTRLLISAGLLVFLALSSQILSQTHAVPDNSGSATLAMLDAPDVRTRWEAVGKLMKEREELIRRLVEIVTSDEPGEFDTPSKRYYSPKRSALSLLGTIRADSELARKALWENLTYEVSIPAGTLNELFDPGQRYPAAAALVLIGKPACERAWHELEGTSDPVRRDLAIYILERVEGRELAQQLVEQKLQKVAGQPENLHNAIPHKRNLERAREWMIDRAKDGSSEGKPPVVGDDRQVPQ